jgi:hypothetical protein
LEAFRMLYATSNSQFVEKVSSLFGNSAACFS